MLEELFLSLREMFSYTFLLRAFVVGALVSICAALLGVSLVLKRYSMIGDGLSHVGFGALAIATALKAAPLAVAIPLCVAAAFLLLRLGERHMLKGDAAIALVSTGALAIGVLIISQTTGMNTDVCNYLFGSILAMNKTDVLLSIILCVVVLVLFILFYEKLFAITFDETFAQVSGVQTGALNMLIALLTALTIVLGMRMMGAMLISALIIFPALTAMRVFKAFKSVSLCAVGVSVFCYFTGIVLSYLHAIPTGASVVLVNICAFVLAVLIEKCKTMVNLSKCSMIVMLPLILFSCAPEKKEYSGELAQSTEPEKVITSEPQVLQKKQDIIEIKEKMFIALSNDVYLNAPDYLGKTIKLEGLFKKQHVEYEGEPATTYYYVLRYGPGCCGADGTAGFEVAWEPRDQSLTKYPEEDAWVEAVGVLKEYSEGEMKYLFIALQSLRELEKRGAEFVSQ